MAHLQTDSQDQFYIKDVRGQLRAWMKENKIDSIDYIKPEVGLFRLIEFLSSKLVDRGEYGVSKFLVQHEIQNCGKTGEYQRNKQTGEYRAIGHYCNHRRYHISCAQRYRKGQALEMRSQYMEIVKSKKLWGLWHWTFTLPDYVRKWINDNEGLAKAFLIDVRRCVSKTIKEALGIGAKARNIQPGFSVLYHYASSGDPFKQSSHFHSIILPLSVDLKRNTIKRFEKYIDHSLVKRIYKKNLDKVLMKYQIPVSLTGQYVVNVRHVLKQNKQGINHLFFYNNRSQCDDILKTIKRDHCLFENFICLLWDKKNEVFLPVIKSQVQVLDALESVFNIPVSVRMSYGFMRVIDKYSNLLGIERDEKETSSEDWETLYRIEIRRDMVKGWDDEIGKVKALTSVYIRRADSQELWRKVKPDELKGESVCLSGRKFYKAVSYGKANNGIKGEGVKGTGRESVY